MRHHFHALCPYFAMFPESFAETWIDRLTAPGDVVLDPFCGRGTAPFQALLMGRQGVGNDVNPVAYCVTSAKTRAPSISAVRRRLTILERQYDPTMADEKLRTLPEFFKWAYSEPTLRQLLFLRGQLRWRDSDTDCLIGALVLGSLHGESSRSPSYFSNQMPRTISTKPKYSIAFWSERKLSPPRRDVFAILRNRLAYRYQSSPPSIRGLVLQGDMRELPRRRRELPTSIRCVITSPPYLDVTNFEEDQWLRLWFLGGPPRPTKGLVSKDDRHETRDSYWRLLADMWRSLGHLLDEDASVVIRIAGKGLEPTQLVDGLIGTSVFARRDVRLVSREVTELRGRQTQAFRPGSTGLLQEVDCHFLVP
jgi:hypothetical protein